MEIYPVKNNKLLKQKQVLLDKQRLIKIILNVINYLLKIEDKNGNYILNLDDGRKINSKEWYGWEWTQGIALYSIYKFYKLTNYDYLLKIIDNWFNLHLCNTLPNKNINTICPLLTLAYRYEDTKKYFYLPILEIWSNWLIYDLPKTKLQGFQHIVYHKENNQEIWDDTLMMSILPLVKIGLVLNKPNLINEAIYQILLHIQYLMNKQSGLWYHGWNFNKLTYIQ